VGKGSATLTSFAPHSSYSGGLAVPDSPVTAIYGLSDSPFVLGDNYNSLELSGVLGGRAQYVLGWSAGANAFGGTFNSSNAYASAGYKLGGMRLDGEGSTGPADPRKPWAERALTLYGFAYHSEEHFANPADTSVPASDTSLTVGGGLRGQLDSAELDLGYYQQSHKHGTADLGKVDAGAAFGELSYVVFPWLIPFVRAQRLELRPSGGSRVDDLLLMPGLTFLVRPNIKVTVAGSYESASGFPGDADGNPLPWQGGGGDMANFVIAPPPGATTSTKRNEFSSITFLLAWAL
jgi:hypothetical protein